MDLAEHKGRIFLVRAVQKWNSLTQNTACPQPDEVLVRSLRGALPGAGTCVQGSVTATRPGTPAAYGHHSGHWYGH